MASRVAQRPAAASSSTTTTVLRNRAPQPQTYSRNAAAALGTSLSSANSRGTAYTSERVMINGREQEVLTIEDTPEPNFNETNLQINSRTYPTPTSNGAQLGPPAAKKRKSDGAHISDQPYPAANSSAAGYAASTVASSSRQRAAQPATTYSARTSQQHVASNAYPAGNTYKASTTAGTKRKAGDPYGDYEKPRAAVKARAKSPEVRDGRADKDGHFIVKIGDTLHDKIHNRIWTITRPLGSGTFGKVVAAKCPTFDGGVERAIKIIRAVPKYTEAAKLEIDVLEKLGEEGAERHNCVGLEEDFEFLGHKCLQFKMLSSSVFDFLKENRYRAFPYAHIQYFAKQLLTSVKFVHDHGFIHTDLKPENILLRDNNYFVPKGQKAEHVDRRILNDARICLIDFGSAAQVNGHHATVVSTRHYRAPEIILGLPWSKPIDVWSIGCILVEFLTGEALFQTHENLEHLAMMERVFGNCPTSVLADAVKRCRANKADDKSGLPLLEWFKSESTKIALSWPQPTTQKSSMKFVKGMRPLDQIIPGVAVHQARFRDLVTKLLNWDQSKRLTVAQALQHDFFNLRIDWEWQE